MNYEKSFELVYKVVLWMEKATKLKVKYEHEKYTLLKEIRHFYDKRKFTALREALTQIRVIVEKKQLPLYNNLVNYSENVLLPFLVGCLILKQRLNLRSLCLAYTGTFFLMNLQEFVKKL